jgi:mannose/cellobiose epimerase-like protein (N-acyl-D-glucosamine 2-epimerase family)
MHLLEAALAAYETTEQAKYADLAEHLYELVVTRLIQHDGALPELFDETWNAAPGPAGRDVEPGHLFEWAWLLSEYSRVMNRPRSSHIERLISFAEKQGVDPDTNAVYLRLNVGGVCLDQSTRSWCSAERLKAALISGSGQFAEDAARGALNRLFERHFISAPLGGWIDAFDARDEPASDRMPASTLYHVFLAFSELMRVAPGPDLSNTVSQEQQCA